MASTGETASFCVRRGGKRLCLFRADSPHLLRMHVRPGDALPLDWSANVQVLHAFVSRARPRRGPGRLASRAPLVLRAQAPFPHPRATVPPDVPRIAASTAAMAASSSV